MTAATFNTRSVLYQKGDASQEVALLQQYLSAIGFSTQGADGRFGPNTEAAVKAFQSSVGQAPDGYVWLETFNELVRQYEARGGKPAPMPSIVPVASADPAALEASGDPFPRWAIYVGLAAAGAVALYFFTQKDQRIAALADYGHCGCDDESTPFAGHPHRKRARR